ncbi:hypothetical protein BWI97_23205 [Siphonobacter sp. BAB-5405]|nr:hypothetical protein BWI97_23205 [Siphonobacter sp. BAB-5405]
MEGNTEKPFGIVRGITFSTMNMKRTNLAETEGNPGDQISTLIFRNVEWMGYSETLKISIAMLHLKR